MSIRKDSDRNGNKGVIERLLDSVILIDHFNGISRATGSSHDFDPARRAISVITRDEILVGFDEEETEKPKALMDQFHL